LSSVITVLTKLIRLTFFLIVNELAQLKSYQSKQLSHKMDFLLPAYIVITSGTNPVNKNAYRIHFEECLSSNVNKKKF